MALTLNNIECEISYAYVHAVAAKAGLSSAVADRHADADGIDVYLHASGNLGGTLTSLRLELQLKATRKPPLEIGDTLSYFLTKKSYDDLRQNAQSQRILVVLFLPEEAEQWLDQSEEELAIRRCAYWLSLRGAEPTENSSGVTVHLPKTNIFKPDSLLEIVRINSQLEYIDHAS